MSVTLSHTSTGPWRTNISCAKGSGGWYVMEVLPGEALVLQVGDVRAGRPIHRDSQLRWEFSWSFVVRPAPGGRSRLLVRERTGFGSRLSEVAMSPIGIISFVMTQKMLREIKVRAEAVTCTVPDVDAGAARERR
ncbi:MAG: hypothetical protein IPM45_04110 [Acidimicrobiales bacterium]|nr:hypothetical protein [Acidimicrobiales bacterium]